MKALLINPSWGGIVNQKGKRFNRHFPPLDLLYCGALLENHGIYVELIDANVSSISNVEIASYAKKFDKVFITSSPFYQWQCPNLDFQIFLEFLEPFLKENLYLYGSHCSLFPEEILRITRACAVLRGEPEATVTNICLEKDLKKVDGVTYHNGDKIVSNKERELIPLDSLPLPAIHLIDPKKYGYEILGNNLMIFEGARGCPYKCIFCLQIMHGYSYRKKSVEKLIQEVDFAIETFGVRNGYFYDMEFSINRKLVETLCHHLIQSQHEFSWTCQVRPDSVDEELLFLMKRAGCRLIHFGIEGASDDSFKTMNKGMAIKDVERAMLSAKKVNMATAGFFMFGLPGERKEDFQKTIDFAKRLNPTYASFHAVTPYPGTKLYKMLKEKKEGIDFPEAYTQEHSLKELERVVKKAFFQFYLRPGYIISRLFADKVNSFHKQIGLFLRFLR